MGKVALRAEFRIKVGTLRVLKRLRWLGAISLHLVRQYQEGRPREREAQENDRDASAEISRRTGSGSAAGEWTMSWDANALGTGKMQRCSNLQCIGKDINPKVRENVEWMPMYFLRRRERCDMSLVPLKRRIAPSPVRVPI